MKIDAETSRDGPLDYFWRRIQIRMSVVKLSTGRQICYVSCWRGLQSRSLVKIAELGFFDQDLYKSRITEQIVGLVTASFSRVRKQIRALRKVCNVLFVISVIPFQIIKRLELVIRSWYLLLCVEFLAVFQSQFLPCARFVSSDSILSIFVLSLD